MTRIATVRLARMLAMQLANDMAGMRAALDEARKGLYITTPNPRVGCVIVRDGQIIGRGHTQPAGQAHGAREVRRIAREPGDAAGAALGTEWPALAGLRFLQHARPPGRFRALIVVQDTKSRKQALMFHIRGRP